MTDRVPPPASIGRRLFYGTLPLLLVVAVLALGGAGIFGASGVLDAFSGLFGG